MTDVIVPYFIRNVTMSQVDKTVTIEIPMTEATNNNWIFVQQSWPSTMSKDIFAVHNYEGRLLYRENFWLSSISLEKSTNEQFLNILDFVTSETEKIVYTIALDAGIVSK